jgi:hypothetical protein
MQTDLAYSLLGLCARMLAQSLLHIILPRLWSRWQAPRPSQELNFLSLQMAKSTISKTSQSDIKTGIGEEKLMKEGIA